jgi:CheY-like chemotaxis protein
MAINARDAMGGNGRLTIESRNIAADEMHTASELGLQPGDYVVLSVSDTGVGMSPEALDRAFEPFFTTKEQGHGTGLGLSMVYGFAKSSNGHVTIYSEVGVGTTINLYLPRADADVMLKPDAPELPSGRTGTTILDVEDDERIRRLTRKRLEGLGYHVREAADGPSALQELDGSPEIDLVFSDVVMPGGMTGFDLRDDIRAIHPGVKVLLTSGYAEAAMRREHRNGTDLMFLRKPYRLADLARAIADALDGAE